MRAFVEAVLAYTKAPKVIIIGHSMGVTIGRKIIKGGKAEDEK
jgi:triacylglycerol esterase/lipase EstA (alpha/beta hydrolase family)